jgi:hypothetical protein
MGIKFLDFVLNSGIWEKLFLIISSQFGGGKENAIQNDAVFIWSHILRNMHQLFLF